MNLWIRSQDEKRLIECHELGLQEKLKGEYAIIIANRHIVGTYENKERAINILDEVANIIHYEDSTKYVYDMPKK